MDDAGKLGRWNAGMLRIATETNGQALDVNGRGSGLLASQPPGLQGFFALTAWNIIG